jgi:hypothetical protein
VCLDQRLTTAFEVAGTNGQFKFVMTAEQFSEYFAAEYYMDFAMFADTKRAAERNDVLALSVFDQFVGDAEWRRGSDAMCKLRIAGFRVWRTEGGYANFDFRGGVQIWNAAGDVVRAPSLS